MAVGCTLANNGCNFSPTNLTKFLIAKISSDPRNLFVTSSSSSSTIFEKIAKKCISPEADEA